MPAPLYTRVKKSRTDVGDTLRLGRPSELGALTSLGAAACHLRSSRCPRRWPWPFSLLFGAQPQPAPRSPLRLLEIRFAGVASDPDGSVAPMLLGLPALTTLALRRVRPRHVPARRALAGAFRGLTSLTALTLTGRAEALAAVLEAAAASPALRARLETVEALWEAEHQPLDAEAMLRARLRPFAALRSVHVDMIP